MNRSNAELVDGDMPLAVWPDLGAVPIAPPVTQAEAGELRHQVELRGPGIADLHRVEPDLLVPDHDVLALEPLAYGIVLGHFQPDPLVRHRRDLEAASEVGALRDERLQHEGSAWREMRGDVL